MKYAIKLLCWSGLILLLTACHTKPAPSYHYSTVPLPRELYIDEGTLEITQSTLYYQSDSVQTAAKLLAQSLNRLTKMTWTVQRGTAPKGCITLQINHQLPADMYTLDTRETLSLQAGSYKSLALGIPSLLQSMEIIKGKPFFYRMLIKDRPNYAWRTVMIDVARRWIPLPILRETIELLHYYKISALHLHLSDNESFTFGTTRYPALLTYNQNGSPRYYTKAQLRELVQFAEDRGVTIIPEIDLPGHSSPLWRKMPEVFGALDAEGKPQNLYTVNMVSEKCYTALYALLDEVIAVFDTSPYFHLGGDEVYLKPIQQLKTYRSFCQKHQLKQALKGETQEVYAYFLQQMINKVKACGKQAVLWEGFPNTGAGRILIPKDVLVVAWNTTYNPPQQLVQNGYTIVNAAWIPNYFCPSMNFYPTQKACFNWSPLRFAHWNTSIPDITLPKQTPIAGGQLCFWETQPEKIIPTLETHLPALAEHWWNAKRSSDFKAFQQRMKETQKKLETLLHPISWVVTGLIHQDSTRFTDKLSLRCSSRIPGTIRLTLASDWDSIPHDTICYQKPIVLTQTQVVTAQLYSPEGKKIGYPTQKRYQKIDPCLSYTAFGPAPHKGWNTLPDFDTLQVVRKGYFGQVDHSRYREIQRHLFYKVMQKGHIDTRPEGLDNAFALEMKGTLHISQTGRYQFCVTNKDGLVALTVDQQQWKGKTKDFTPERFTFDLKKGDHPLCIHYYVQHIQNILNITYIGPSDTQERGLETLLKPITTTTQ